MSEGVVDHRRFKRIDFKKGVKFCPPQAQIFLGEAAFDLSRGGIQINSPEFVATGTVAKLQMQLKEETKIIEVYARIVWVKYYPPTESYRLGLEFVGDRAFAEWQIAKYVNQGK